MYSFPKLELVRCSMSSSNCCFLPCIQIFQEIAKMVWYSHLLKNFPQFVVIHTAKGFSIVNEAEVDVYLEFSFVFSIIQRTLAIWSLVPPPFLNPAWTFVSSRFTYCWSLAWRILNITLLVCEILDQVKGWGRGISEYDVHVNTCQDSRMIQNYQVSLQRDLQSKSESMGWKHKVGEQRKALLTISYLPSSSCSVWTSF